VRNARDLENMARVCRKIGYEREWMNTTKDLRRSVGGRDREDRETETEKRKAGSTIEEERGGGICEGTRRCEGTEEKGRGRKRG